jgi:acyl-CoA synthetase (NDP forming)
LTDADANDLVTNGKVGLLLAGFRGAAPADAGSAADVLLRIGRLMDDLPEIAELDLNPVIAGPAGCVVVDARIRVAEVARVSGPKTW